MTTQAAKGRTLFSLAAVCALALAILAPSSASATRTGPGLERPGLGPPPAALDGLLEVPSVADHADRLPLYTTVDVVTLGGASSLEVDQVEAVVARQRYRLHLLSGQLARSDELAWGPKTATGVSTSLGADKHLRWRHLEAKTHRRSYQGLWTDPTTGLSYARNRWYDPRTASFLSEDPLGPVDSPNLYAFVRWAPHMYTDPYGQCVFGAPCPDWVKSTAGYAVGLGQSAGELVAAPVTMAGTEAVNAYYNTARVVDAYRAGGMSRALEKSEIISDEISAESKHRLLGMIPGVNTYRQGSQVVATYEEEGAFAGGMQVGRTTFSLGLDATVVYGTARVATARAAPAPSTSTPKVNLLNNKVPSNASVAELGVVAEANSAARAASASEAVANPVPTRMARVVDARFAESPRLAAPGAEDVFVTAADEIAGVTSSSELASRLALIDDAGNLRQGPFAVIEFDTPVSGVASPVFRTNPGFVQGGTTAGGAVEYVLPNLEVSQLENVTVRIVP